MTNNREDMSSTGKVTSQAKAPLNKKRKEDALDATLSDSSIEELEGPTPSRPRTKRKARRSTMKKTPTSEQCSYRKVIQPSRNTARNEAFELER